jgi:hypothetical protein
MVIQGLKIFSTNPGSANIIKLFRLDPSILSGGVSRTGASFSMNASRNRRGARGTLLIEAGEREGIYLAEFDLDAIRQYRQRETWGNAFRRPHRYGALVALDVAPPFVRVNACGERYDPSQR